MHIGVPREIKAQEYRVGLVPSSVAELTAAGHAVLLETGAGAGIGMDDDAYREAGGRIVETAEAIFAEAELIVKVKEPQPRECALLRPGQTLFAFLHLAPDPDQAKALLASGASAIAYESVTDGMGGLPLLEPMSAVAGRMAAQAGARFLEKAQGGAGILLGGVPGVPPARVCILGAGVAGREAARMCLGLGASVTCLDIDSEKLWALDRIWGNRIRTRHSNRAAVDEEVLAADLVILAVLVPGGRAPRLIPRTLVARMRPGSVIVDIAIDQGGAAETSRPTSHADPVYVEEGVLHYCVTNMPGAVPRTSAMALNNATLPHVLALAGRGLVEALRSDPHLMAGLNVHAGRITCAAVAEALGLDHTPPETALGQTSR